jgi:hypothetical protein
MIGISFGGVRCRNSNLLVTTACQPTFHGLRRLAQKTGWPYTPSLGVDISDKKRSVNLALACRQGWTGLWGSAG